MAKTTHHKRTHFSSTLVPRPWRDLLQSVQVHQLNEPIKFILIFFPVSCATVFHLLQFLWDLSMVLCVLLAAASHLEVKLYHTIVHQSAPLDRCIIGDYLSKNCACLTSRVKLSARNKATQHRITTRARDGRNPNEECDNETHSNRPSKKIYLSDATRSK